MKLSFIQGMIEDSIRGNTQPFLVNYLTGMMDTRLFLRRSVKQLIYGYEDDLLDMAKDQMPEKIKSNRFSLIQDVRFDYLIFCLCNC